MAKTILGRKLGMTQVWSEDDRLIPVTVIEAGPCVVAQVKTPDRDGYSAIQLGYGDIKESKVNKPMAGHYKKAGVTPKRYLSEVAPEDGVAYKVGDEVTVAGIEPGMHVHVTGTTGHGGGDGVEGGAFEAGVVVFGDDKNGHGVCSLNL